MILLAARKKTAGQQQEGDTYYEDRKADSGACVGIHDAVDAVYQNISATTTIVCVSAGNSGTLSESNLIGGDKTENPDNGVVSSPSTYANAISVASVDNAEVMGYYVEADGEKLSYEEGANGYNDSMETLYGQTFEFVMAGGYGEEADYADMNAYVDEEFEASHISLSVNGDGYADIISDIYVTLLRNSESVTVTFADAEDTGNIYNQTVFEKVLELL